VVELSPLTYDDSTRLVENLVQIENLPEDTRRLILNKAEGNPFFLEELLRSLIDAGMVVLQEGQMVVTDAVHTLGALDIPDTLQGVIAARIDRLPLEDKHTLQAAAVVGRVFQQRVLEHLMSQERARIDLDSSLGKLRHRELIRPRESETLGVSEYIFKHALTQEAAYSGLLIARRKALHKAAGEAIETLFPDYADELAATMAHHFVVAGELDRALVYLLKAGERALSTSATSEAIAFLSQAEKIAWEQNRTPQLRRALEGLGDAYYHTGENERAVASYEAALQLWEDSPKRADLCNKIGYVYHMHMNDGAQGLTYYERAITELGEATDTVEMARVSINLAYLFFFDSDPKVDLAEEYLNRALHILQDTEHQRDLASCYGYIALLAAWQQMSERAIDYGQRALAICQRFNLDAPADLANIAVGHGYRLVGDWEQATVFYEASAKVNQVTGYVFGAAYAYSFLAEAYLATGRLEEAIETASKGLALWERLGHPLARLCRFALSVACELAGRADEAAAYREEALAEAANYAEGQYALARRYAIAGQRDKALRILREIAPQIDDQLKSHALTDWSLTSLRDDPEFRQLMEAEGSYANP
jgi:predicted ATPase